MSKEKRPPEEGKDKDSKGYLELDFSGLQDFFERLFYGTKSRKFDGSCEKNGGRLGLDPAYGTAGIASAAVTGIALLLCFVFRAEPGLTLFMLVMFLLGTVLVCIGKYEIRFDGKGFSTRFGKHILHAYKWSDVTDVQDNRKVWVKGKRLLTDHTFDAFPEFYKMARAACKGSGKSAPTSKKKQKARKQSS